MIDEDKGSADDTCEKADGSVDAIAAALEVAETAKLKCFQLRVYILRLISNAIQPMGIYACLNLS